MMEFLDMFTAFLSKAVLLVAAVVFLMDVHSILYTGQDELKKIRTILEEIKRRKK